MTSQELRFPVEWHYKIITEQAAPDAKHEIEKALARNGIAGTLEAGNESAAGKYRSYKISVTFNDLTTMRRISNELALVRGVKFLI